ncbi:MAG: hypothetical protein ACPGYV_05370 [Phycisphaeraceae bacterium]
MREAIAQFREVLAATDPVAAVKLMPGLSRDAVVKQIQRLPFRITPDAVELYSTMDGSADDPLELLPGSYFINLESAVDEFEQLAPMRDELDDIFPQQYRDSVRFLSDWSDGGYAFGAVESPAKGQIVDWVIHDEWKLAFASLEKLLITATECRKRGVFGDGDIPDFELYYQIGRELNPEMETWLEQSGDGG